MEAQESRARSRLESRGQWIAAGIVLTLAIGGFYVILQGYALEGMVPMVAGIAALAGLFIYGRRARSMRSSTINRSKDNDTSDDEIPRLENPSGLPDTKSG